MKITNLDILPLSLSDSSMSFRDSSMSFRGLTAESRQIPLDPAVSPKGSSRDDGIPVDKEKKLKEADSAAKEFETLFVDMMLKSMRETAKPEDESNAESIYKSMLDNEYSKTMTDAQSFGIREMVRQWIVDNS